MILDLWKLKDWINENNCIYLRVKLSRTLGIWSRASFILWPEKKISRTYTPSIAQLLRKYSLNLNVVLITINKSWGKVNTLFLNPNQTSQLTNVKYIASYHYSKCLSLLLTQIIGMNRSLKTNVKFYLQDVPTLLPSLIINPGTSNLTEQLQSLGVRSCGHLIDFT